MGPDPMGRAAATNLREGMTGVSHGEGTPPHLDIIEIMSNN